MLLIFTTLESQIMPNHALIDSLTILALGAPRTPKATKSETVLHLPAGLIPVHDKAFVRALTFVCQTLRIKVLLYIYIYSL